MGLSIDEQKAVERFKTDVVEPSMSKLVILDFHAEWCGPCKALAPMLEKVAAEYADKGVVLKKVDVDAEKFIAAQFQVQSIPTVYAMFQGQPVADLTNARSESQLKQTLDQILAQLPLDGGGDNGAAGGQQQQQQAQPPHFATGFTLRRLDGVTWLPPGFGEHQQQCNWRLDPFSCVLSAFMPHPPPVGAVQLPRPSCGSPTMP